MPNTERAKNILTSSKQAIETAKIIPFRKQTLKTIFRELYEGLREYCEAIGYLKGYKFLDHESISYFITEILREETLANQFDRYRKLRNKINYYGEEINAETVQEAITQIPPIIHQLEAFKSLRLFPYHIDLITFEDFIINLDTYIIPFYCRIN